MKILTEHPKLHPTEKFEKNELKFVKLLEADKELEVLIDKARKVCGIPEEGFILDSPLEDYFRTGVYQKMNFEKVLEEAEYITHLYPFLPTYWLGTFTTIIMFSFAMPPLKAGIKPIEIKGDKYEATIVVREKMSSSKIKKYIDHHKPELDVALKQLPSGPTIKVQDIEIKNKMIELHNAKEPLAKIGEKLNEEYGNRLPFEYDYNSIGSEVSRYRKYLNKILNKDWRGAMVHQLAAQIVKKQRNTSDSVGK